MFHLLLLTSLLSAPSAPTSWEARYTKAIDKLNAASSPAERYYALRAVAKAAFEVGRVEEAEKYALELLEASRIFRGDWNYGNAIHDGHMVLGRIAVRRGDVNGAKRELLLAGRTPGSPQLDSFGPNMSLAKDLIQEKQIATVAEYFELCRRFWEMERGRLARWTEEMKAGVIPDFGPNLVY